MPKHTNGVTKGVVSAKEVVHEDVLMVPVSIGGSTEEAGHVISQGTNNVVGKQTRLYLPQNYNYSKAKSQDGLKRPGVECNSLKSYRCTTEVENLFPFFLKWVETG